MSMQQTMAAEPNDGDIEFVKQADAWLHNNATFDQAMDFYEDFTSDPACSDYVIAEMGRRDRYFLFVHLLGGHYGVHPWLYERCREVEADTDNHIDLWSRGHFKSTLITYAGIIQEVLNDPEITIGIFSFKAPIAKKFLAQIKREFESNEALKHYYKDVLYEKPAGEAPVWSLDSGIVVRRKGNPREATIEAHGLVDGQPTSRHFDLLVYDDVVTDKSVNTPEQIEKTTDAYDLSLNLGSRDGKAGEIRKWLIGTRYAYGDTYQAILDRGVVKPRLHPATDDGTFDGNPVFLSPSEWENLKRERGTYSVACQQLQNPIAGSEQTFDIKWLRYYEIRPKTLNIYIMCDPAGSKKKGSDKTAMVVVGIDASLNKYLLDGVCHRMKLSERWEYLKGFRNKWIRQPGVQLVKVGYEKYGMQSDIEHFEEMMRISGNHFSIEELNWPSIGSGSHRDRVQRLQPEFQNWRFFLPYAGKICSPDDMNKPQWVDVQQSRTQLDAIGRGQEYLVAKTIKQVNEDNRVYNVVEFFIKNDYLLFPSVHVDFMDAMSRIYDMDIAAPVAIEQEAFDPEPEADF